MKIRCYTLFDITNTNISHRQNHSVVTNQAEYVKQRNQQANFETMLQVISMRSQPENITTPKQLSVSKKDLRWGDKIQFKTDDVIMWSFSFTISHSGVFADENSNLGKLLTDCDGVPMLLNLDESVTNVSQLNTSSNLKNVEFEIVEDE
jgi:hypothetical protein